MTDKNKDKQSLGFAYVSNFKATDKYAGFTLSANEVKSLIKALARSDGAVKVRVLIKEDGKHHMMVFEDKT